MNAKDRENFTASLLRRGMTREVAEAVVVAIEGAAHELRARSQDTAEEIEDVMLRHAEPVLDAAARVKR